MDEIEKLKFDLKKMQETLADLEEQKQYYVESAIKKSEVIQIKDKLMINQAKLAAMGEMLGAVAHQWKQPLSTINSLLIDIQTIFMNDERMSLLEKKLDNIEELTSYMAQTIEDFRNYINPKSSKTNFLFSSVLKNALNVFASNIEKNKISFKTNYLDEISIYGNEKEFIQSLLIFFNNSKDAFIANNIKNPTIKLTTREIQNNKIIRIEDNAGGIGEDTLSKVFEPYFSTKQHLGGTGLGLYMAKLLIEDGMNGKLKISSTNDTTEIKIILLGLKDG